MSYIVLVCTGWRKMHKLPNAPVMVKEWFDYVERSHGRIVLVMEGGQRGADELCGTEADRRGIERQTVAADWTLGRKGGPLRNKKMAYLASQKEGEGVRVIGLAFLAPESSGTVDMVSRLEPWAQVEKVHLPHTELVA